MKFADKFKNNKQISVISKEIQKANLDKMDISQNEAIQFLEEEKNKEKDEKMRANYDYIITLIKNWFANQASFNAKKAQQTILKILSQKNESLNKNIKSAIQNPNMIILAKQMFKGENFVNYIINNYLSNNAKQQWELKRN